MVNSQIFSYVKERVVSGASDSDVLQVLTHAGWREMDVLEVLRKVRMENGGDEQPSPVFDQIPSVGILINETFGIFKKYFWKIMVGSLLIVLIQLLFRFLINLLSSGISEQALIVDSNQRLKVVDLIMLIMISSLVLGIIISVLSSFVTISYYFIISGRDGKKLGDLFNDSFKKLWPYVLTHVLVFFVVVGGMIVVVPAILFSLWYLMAHIVFLEEDVRGINALLKSKFYVRKYVGAIIWRFFAFSVFLLMCSFPVFFILWLFGALGFPSQYSDFLDVLRGVLFQLLGTPLSFIFLYKVFSYVKRMPREEEFNPSKKEKLWVKVYAVIGVILSIGYMAIFFHFVVPRLENVDVEFTKEELYEKQGLHMEFVLKNVQKDMQNFEKVHGRYPNDYDEFGKDFIGKEPKNIINRKAYEYEYWSMNNGGSYQYCLRIDDIEKCVNPATVFGDKD